MRGCLEGYRVSLIEPGEQGQSHSLTTAIVTARQKAATIGGIVIDTRARLGYTAPIGTTDHRLTTPVLRRRRRWPPAGRGPKFLRPPVPGRDDGGVRQNDANRCAKAQQ